MRVVQERTRPFTLVQQGLTRAIVNPETLSTQCLAVTPTTELYAPQRGIRPLLNHLLEKVMGELESYGGEEF